MVQGGDDLNKVIQRVLDDRYPLARELWKDFQVPQDFSHSQYGGTKGPLTGTGKAGEAPPTASKAVPEQYTAYGEYGDRLDKVIQRVIDPRYPCTRVSWQKAQEDRPWLSRAAASRDAPVLTNRDDPHWETDNAGSTMRRTTGGKT